MKIKRYEQAPHGAYQAIELPCICNIFDLAGVHIFLTQFCVFLLCIIKDSDIKIISESYINIIRNRKN